MKVIEKIVLIVYSILILIILFLPNNKCYLRENLHSNKKVVFLHIPKNAGTTFKSFFPECQHKRHCDSFPRENEINIAILRDPKTRLQSIFAHIKWRDIDQKSSNDLNEFDTLHDLAKAYYDIWNPYHIKAKRLLDWDMDKFKQYKYIQECGKNTPCIHWCPQHYYINGHSANTEYLINFENINNDIKKLQSKNILRNVCIDRERKQVSPNKYKKLTEMTPLCEKLVRDVYGKDFELWNESGIS